MDMSMLLWNKVSALTEAQAAGGSGRIEAGNVLLNMDSTNNDSGGEWMYEGSIGIEKGKTYTVILDSGRYNAVCKLMDGSPFLGNAALLNDTNEDTDESFCVWEIPNEDTGGVLTVVIDASEGRHVTVISSETIHPIDPKFLPTVEIDLDALGITETILALSQTGGIADITVPHEKLWGRITDDSPVRMRLTMPYQDTGLEIIFESTCTTKTDGNRNIIAMFFMQYDQTSFMQIILQMGNYDENGSMYVMVKTNMV